MAVADSIALKTSFFRDNAGRMLDFYRMLQETEGSVYIFGNGGSAADAQHFAAELMHRVEKTPIRIRAHALHTDTSLLTALTFHLVCSHFLLVRKTHSFFLPFFEY